MFDRRQARAWRCCHRFVPDREARGRCKVDACTWVHRVRQQVVGDRPRSAHRLVPGAHAVSDLASALQLLCADNFAARPLVGARLLVLPRLASHRPGEVCRAGHLGGQHVVVCFRRHVFRRVGW